MNNPAHKLREPVSLLMLTGLSLVLGCSSSSGKTGNTLPVPAVGGSPAAGGGQSTPSSPSGGGGVGGSVTMGGGPAGGGVSGGDSAGGRAFGGTTVATAGNGGGDRAMGGMATVVGGSSRGGETGVGDSGAGGVSTGGISTGGLSTAMGGSNASGGTASGGSTGSAGGQTATGGKGGGGGGGAGGEMATGGKGGSAGSAGGEMATGGKGGSAGSAGGEMATGGKGGSGGTAGGGTVAGGQASGGSAPGGSPAAITKDSEGLLTSAGLTIVSYGGYLNGESFQQDGIVSFKGYQYAAFWNSSRHVVIARRALPNGSWSSVEFTDYSLAADDAHNTISLGICPGDGTLHLSFDHHSNDLHYRKSMAGLVANPGTAVWTAASFSAVTSSLVGSTTVALVTYPRFVTEPDGTKMLFEARIGTSGSGDEYLWEYDAATHSWTALGMYISGTADSINAYPHGLSYTPGGARLHLSWCWRETPDASTNHDLLYLYSDDHGRSWKNNAGTTVGTTGTTFVSKNSVGIKVWTINQNRGLINQEHMAIDTSGRVHVLLSHMPDAQADDATFTSARSKSQFFDYWRNSSGTWTRIAMGLPVVANFRGKLAISAAGNVYAVLPDLRIAAASAASNFAAWAVVNNADAGRFFSDPLIDAARLALEDKLTVFYPQKSSPNIYLLDYSVF